MMALKPGPSKRPLARGAALVLPAAPLDGLYRM